MQNFSVKGKIFFGANAISKLEEIEANKVFIVADEMMVKIGAVKKVSDHVQNKAELHVFSKVKPDPSVEIVGQGVKEMQEIIPDLLIAVGGGSVIDTAKAILFTLWQMGQEQKTSFQKPLFAAVPTTSGTGSEVTNFSIVTIGDSKLSFVDDWMIPDVAVVDPQFVASVPPAVTADTGLDVLSHALEAYVSTNAMDFTDALCEKIVKNIFDYLITAYEHGDDMDAREKMHNASCMAGIAFTNTSLGILHSLAHALGGAFHIPHGRAIAVLMPAIIAYNAAHDECAEKKYAELAHLLGLEFDSLTAGCASLIDAVQALKEMMNVPKTICDAGVDKEVFEDKIDLMSNNAMNDSCMLTTPFKPTLEDIKELYRQAFGK